MQLVTRSRFYLDVSEEIEKLAKLAGEQTPLRWDEALQRTIKQLLAHPSIGRKRADLKPSGIRSWRVKGFPRWLVFYRLEVDRLILLRVRYGTMDLPRLEMES